MSNRIRRKGTRVQPAFYSKEGYDRGTVLEVLSGGRCVRVQWDNHPEPLIELVSDLVALAA